MTENDMMEELSLKYVEAIASKSGYFNQSGRDYGTDCTFRKAVRSKIRGKRFLTSGLAIDVQIKSVYERNITHKGGIIAYDMEVKNFNDLIERKAENGDFIPLYLIVFIVPNRITDWVTVTQNELSLKKCAYWYEVGSGLSHCKNKTTQRIFIPETNILDLNLFDTLFSKLN